MTCGMRMMLYPNGLMRWHKNPETDETCEGSLADCESKGTSKRRKTE